MKKVVSMLLIGLFCLGFGLAAAENEPESKDFELTLTSNPTTGYSWVYVLSEEDIVAVEENFLTAADLYTMVDGAEPTDEPMEGEEGLDTFTVKGLKPGEVILALEYAQSWDDASTQVGLTYQLLVTEDLRVVCTACTAGI